MEFNLSDNREQPLFSLIDSWQQSNISQQEVCKIEGIA